MDYDSAGKSMKEYDSKLIPILREGVEIIKMVLFKEIQNQVKRSYPDEESRFCNMITGSVLNEIFSQPNPEEPFATFRSDNMDKIKRLIAELAETGERILIPLTDALRIQTICDRIEIGDDDDTRLHNADNLGILLKDRDLPMPHSFLDLVRRMGSSVGLIIPPQPKQSTPPA